MSPRLRVLRGEAGIGLIELLIALTVLAVGIAGTLALFGGSILSLQHASKEGTAVTLADRQLETYRSMPFSCIPMQSQLTGTALAGCGTYSGFPNPYSATQTTSASESPDHRTYVVTTAISSATGSTYQIKVTVAQSGTGTILATETSYFSSAGSSG